MLWDFIKKYYIDSIVYKQGYNPVNTLTWALILVAAVILIYRTLKKYDVKFDERFVAGNIPYVILGASVRVVEDAGFLNPPVSYFFMTPLIYVVIFCIAFPTLVLSIRLRGERYWIHYGMLGLVLSCGVLVLLFSNLEVVNAWILPSTIILASLFCSAYRLLTSKFYSPMSNLLSYMVFFSHMVDGWATFFGIQFLGYWELHVLPRFLISTFGPWIMIPAKVIVFAAILYVLDSSRDEEDTELINFVKFVLIVLGLAPGLRDALRMTFQV
ncbi:DUF63 family protein [Archaeoglobus veneficus]|uniref:DUF63 family protein n=1 Tax=Archaeoglobus veneficus (strain DSM 11195 / SNP6) TaxID=693661 RepID=F2KN62_ARCVS|nr:DUF63 family protein [Archaeoglobus veneficus]AEA46163.1 protein of unknown function DUF63 [Archaeoglobus veneficus SNP6]